VTNISPAEELLLISLVHITLITFVNAGQFCARQFFT